MAVSGACAAWLAHRASDRRRRLIAGAAALTLALVAPAAWRWGALCQALVTALPHPHGAAVALGALLGAAACAPLGLLLATARNAERRVRAVAWASYGAGLALLGAPIGCAAVLFADHRALGAVAALSGATAALFGSRAAARDLT
jgi:hypothetical protein